MKRIIIDLYKTKNLNSGLGQFSMNFAMELLKKQETGFHYNFLVPRKTDLQLSDAGKMKVSVFRRLLPSANKSFDIWHSLQQFPSHFPSRNTKQILTVHDLNFLLEKEGPKREKYRRKLQINVSRADYITCISEFTRKTLEENIQLNGKPVTVIHNGVGIAKTTDIAPPNYTMGKKFFFSIGIFNKKKNFEALIPFMRNIPDALLIIAGDCSTAYGTEIRKLISELQLSDRILLPGTISEAEKNWLYSNCEALLFPSLAEGFGLPVIEAMLHGKPVFLSKHTSLPEIGGEQAFYFNSFDPEEMANQVTDMMKGFYHNREQNSELLIKHGQKYSWELCINRYIDLYKSLKICE